MRNLTVHVHTTCTQKETLAAINSEDFEGLINALADTYRHLIRNLHKDHFELQHNGLRKLYQSGAKLAWATELSDIPDAILEAWSKTVKRVILQARAVKSTYEETRSNLLRQAGKL